MRFLILCFAILAQTASADEYADFINKHRDETETVFKASVGCRKTADIMLETPVPLRDKSSVFRCWEVVSNFQVNIAWDYESIYQTSEKAQKEFSEEEKQFHQWISDINSNETYISKALDKL